MESVALAKLEAELLGCRDVDDVAVTTLRSLVSVPGVVRAGLALTMVGGRQLRFLASDARSLGPSPSWCLIDAYDHLPLNDAVRTGTEVLLGTPRAFREAYPQLAARQAGRGVRNVVALPLGTADERLGGLLAYGDQELPDVGGPTRTGYLQLAALVARALLAVRRHGDSWNESDLPDGGILLPADATAPGAARHLLRETLTDLDVDEDTVEAAILCASEVVTNVVMHTGRSSLLSVERADDGITVRVQHPSLTEAPTIAPTADDDPLRISGRGLELVDAVASAWGSETSPAGTTTWYRLDL